MEKIAFLGDFVLTNTKTLSREYFREICDISKFEKIRFCVNLESPVVDDTMRPQKSKICLKCDISDVATLFLLNPYLVNLSNNHINDYGNASVELTRDELKKKNISFFGVGYAHEKQNKIFEERESNVIYVAFCSRSSDFTGNKLFAERDFIGGWEVDIEEIKQIKMSHPECILIVNVHWGIENIKYPEKEKCLLAKKIIDAGADIIIGHHPHIIQPFEKYKNKYIFYSIGNFYFPEIDYELHQEKRILKILSHQKKGIVPVVGVRDGKVFLLEVLLVENTDLCQKIRRNYPLQKIRTDTIIYSVRTRFYMIIENQLKFVRNKLILLVRNPRDFFKRFAKWIKK